MLAIFAEGVSKRYKGLSQTALSNVSLSAESGQIYTLLGRNGAGKTTFVRICATQLMPTRGRIQVLGYDVIKEADKVRKIISIVPQEGRPLRALTPWDHVYNWLQIRGENKKVAKEKTEKILEKLDLYNVAMAMSVDAQLLFLDEPTIGLDPVSRRQVWSVIKDWKKKGKSILLTTHYMDEAEMLSDNIVIIDNGQIIAKGTIKELRRIIPENTRIDISRDNIDTELFKSYGSIVDSGTNTIRIFTYESAVKEVTELAIKKNLSFTVSPITLDDVFLSLVGGIEEERRQGARGDLKNDRVTTT
jgi:ABC-2 type transport system ATP-binding protein